MIKISTKFEPKKPTQEHGRKKEADELQSIPEIHSSSIGTRSGQKGQIPNKEKTQKNETFSQIQQQRPNFQPSQLRSTAENGPGRPQQAAKIRRTSRDTNRRAPERERERDAQNRILTGEEEPKGQATRRLRLKHTPNLAEPPTTSDLGVGR